MRHERLKHSFIRRTCPGRVRLRLFRYHYGHAGITLHIDLPLTEAHSRSHTAVPHHLHLTPLGPSPSRFHTAVRHLHPTSINGQFIQHCSNQWPLKALYNIASHSPIHAHFHTATVVSTMQIRNSQFGLDLFLKEHLR